MPSPYTATDEDMGFGSHLSTHGDDHGQTGRERHELFATCAEELAPRSVFLESGLRSLENLFPIVADRLNTELFDQKLKDFFNRYASSG